MTRGCYTSFYLSLCSWYLAPPSIPQTFICLIYSFLLRTQEELTPCAHHYLVIRFRLTASPPLARLFSIQRLA